VTGASSSGLPPLARLPLLILGFIGLFIGVGAGLARLGWATPALASSAAALHGPLMICGFFGVVISLERAVAIGRLWAYAGPLAAGIGSVAVVHGAVSAGAWFYFAASIVLLAASLDILRRQRALFTLTIALGALAWSVGSALWAMGGSAHDVVTWWLAFLILTIAGERLELSRFLPPSRIARAVFVLLLAVIAAGLVGTAQRWGAPVFALGLIGLALWLLKQDIARRTVRKEGLTRFIAVCLLTGYVWLAVAGAIALAAGGLHPGTPSYDAALHALTLGFVFAMVFGHAPIIFPAVLRVDVPYHASFYLPLALLHASVALRLAGDALGHFGALRAGGLLGAIALAAFVANTVAAVVRGRLARTR
jgi:hypothetical protein